MRLLSKGTSADDSHFDVGIVGIVGLPARYGGFETLAEHLVAPLSATRRVIVYCSAKASPQRLTAYKGARLEYLNWDANGWQSMIYDATAMFRSARRCRALLVLGVSGCLALPLVRLLGPRLRIVTNIDGLEWKRQKWGRAARWVLKLSEAIAVRFSDVVIADNRAIQEYVQRRYSRASILITYGGDHMTSAEDTAAPPMTFRFAPDSYFLTICRIEPENNIATILEAFSSAPDAAIVLVGNWGVSAYANALRERFAGCPNIELLDPIYEEDLLATLRRGARAYVHGHSAGGTNPSLVEAMHGGLAVLAYNVDYNHHTMGGRGWYWSTADELAGLLRAVTQGQLVRCGAELRRHAQANYTWKQVAEAYAALL